MRRISEGKFEEWSGQSLTGGEYPLESASKHSLCDSECLIVSGRDFTCQQHKHCLVELRNNDEAWFSTDPDLREGSENGTSIPAIG